MLLPSGHAAIERGPESLAELFLTKVLKTTRINGACQDVSAGCAGEHDVDTTCLLKPPVYRRLTLQPERGLLRIRVRRRRDCATPGALSLPGQRSISRRGSGGRRGEDSNRRGCRDNRKPDREDSGAPGSWAGSLTIVASD